MDTGIPRKIGRYTIDRLLGSGAMGFVFLGRDPELDRLVAIKTIRARDLGEEAQKMFLERFRNEARAAARLQHPSIVQVYDVGEDTEVGPYLVFEYVQGSTLKQLIRARGPLSHADAVRLADEIAGALEAAHGSGIIHRDIKPENLLMTPDGRAKLADFGVARVPNASLTREGQFLGTPCYAAPETLVEGKYGPHSDIFSFAAVLYEVVSGMRAFPGDDAVAVAHKVIHDAPPMPSEVAPEGTVSEAIDAVVMQGLSKDPDHRFATAREMADAFHDALADTMAAMGTTLPERPPTGPIRLPRESRPPQKEKSGALGFLAVVAVGCAVGIGVVFYVLVNEPLEDVVDAGVAIETIDAGRPREPRHRTDAGQAQATDAERPRDAPVEAAAPDAAVEAPPLDRHQAEELAKDALDRARRAMDSGDFAAARAALEEARRYDPEYADIEREAARLVELEAASQ